MKCTLVKNFLFVAFLEVILTCALAQQSIPSFLCEGVPTGEYVRNVTDCRAWIRCKAVGPVSGACPEPYFFDQLHQTCDWLENVDCYNCPNPDATLEYLPVPNNCNRFIRCIKNVSREFICDEGLQFNSSTKQCESGVNCKSSDTFQCPSNLKPGEFSAINDADNCSIGKVCVGDPEVFLKQCNETLHYNIETLTCVIPEKSGCTVLNPITTTTSRVPPTATTTIHPDQPPSSFFFK